MTTDPLTSSTEAATTGRDRLSRLAWLPIPLLFALIAGFWVANPRTVYESRSLMVLLNLLFTWLASLCICILTARGFLGTGQPGLLMFGCGSLLWGITSLAAAIVVDRVNPTITIHNIGVLVAALCHLVGLLWRGRLHRPGRWLAVAYPVAVLISALIVWAALAQRTPLFFVQGQGGTLVRQVVLLLAVAVFATVAAQLLGRFWQQSGAFYYWYGLGLGLVATGLIGVLLLTVQGGILGWTNRLTQYLGSAYLFIAAWVAAREANAWTLSLAAIDDALQKYWPMADDRRQRPSSVLWRYGVAVLAVAGALGLRLALTALFGPGLPAYITFYPAVMAVAILAGFGPGMAATVLTASVVTWGVLPPAKHLAIASSVDRVGLVIFCGMGVFLSLVADLYRRARDKAAAYDRQAALRESQEFRALAESMPQIVWATRADGWNIYFNQQWVDYTGMTMEESYGHGWNKPFHPDDKQRAWEAWQRATQHGERYSLECRLRRADGVYRWWLVRGVPMLGANGEVLKWFGTCTDIEEIKHAEAALREANDLLEHRVAERTAALQESEERFHGMFERHHAVKLVIEPETGAIVDANAAAARFYGYSREQLCERRIQDINQLPPNEVAAERAKAAAEQRNYFVFPHRLASGEVRWVEVYSTPVETRRRRLLHSIVHDITARKAAEEALSQAGRMLTEAQKIAHLGSFEYIAATRTTVWSEEEFRIYGLDPAGPAPAYELMLAKCIHPDDAALLHETFAAAMRAGSIYELEHRIVRPDGSVRFVYDRAHPQFDKDGKLARYLGATLDITERKQAEVALRESQEMFAKAFAGNAAAIALTRLDDGVFLDVNDSWLALNGYDRDEVMGRSARRMRIWPTAEAAQRFVDELKRTGSVRGWEQEFFKKSGESFIAQLSAQIMTIRGEKVILSTLVDTTARKASGDWKSPRNPSCKCIGFADRNTS